ncbi:MAG: hypothetical protein CVU42_00965 [Chloroflexi bacterium HGW-Chloroflexi-4]|jgi:hypothetical protein|nr:MAG: hypothetical protein CVU42_00965 [Chloroflexi bacterium HGW-Chloroflexi-4]
MAEPKTKPTDQPVAEFIDSFSDVQKRQEYWTIYRIMQEVSGAPGQMWGTSIVGFGKYAQTGSDGKTNDWPLIGFSPRKQALTLYLFVQDLPEASSLLANLGKHSVSKGCLYIKRFGDVDLPTLTDLIKVAYQNAVKNHLS